MVVATAKKQQATLERVASELKRISAQLEKLLRLIPEESVKEYRNAAQIRKAYRRATQAFVPR